MNNFLKYLKLQSLRTVKKYPIILAFTIMLTVSIFIFVNAMFSSNDMSEEKQKIKIGLVGDLSDTYLDIGISTIQNFDISQYYVDFIEMDKEEAVEALKKHELLGYVEVPDGFINSILTGDNLHLTYMAANSPSTIGPVMMNEVVQLVSQLVLEAQNGIYGYMTLALDRGYLPQEIYSTTDRMALNYVDMILTRDKMYTIKEYGVGEELSFNNYYISAFLVLILLLWGMTSVSLLVKSSMSLSRTLKSSGHNSMGLIVGEYFPFFVMICINMLLLILSIWILTNVGVVEQSIVPQLNSFGGCISTFISIIPAIALITVVQFFIYELSTNVISAVLTQILAAVAMSYASGFFFPLYSMPQSIQSLATILPTHKAFNCIADAFFDFPDMTNVMTIWGYFSIFILLSIFVRQYKMRSNRYD